MRAYPLVLNVIIDKTVKNEVAINATMSYDGKPFDALLTGVNVSVTNSKMIEFKDYDVKKDVDGQDDSNIFMVLRKMVLEQFTKM